MLPELLLARPTETPLAPACRHVRNFSVSHVEFRAAKDDLRPTAILDDVTNVDLDHAKFPHAAEAAGLVVNNVAGLVIRNSPGLPEATRAEKIEHDKF